MSEFEIEKLVAKYSFADQPALQDVSFSIPKGEFTLILGQNGSGKSTLLRCLAGFQNWSEGEITRRGQSRSYDRENFNADLLFISEDIALPLETLKNLSKVYSSIWEKFDKTIFDRVLTYGNVSEAKYPAQLSKGQKILAQFALALATRSETLIVDEVTAALDPFVRREVIKELVALQKAGGTVILATNIATEVKDVIANVVLLKKGQIFFDGTTNELGKRFSKIVISSEHRKDAENAEFIEVAKFQNEIEMVGELSKLKDLKVPYSVSKSDISVEDVFVYLSFWSNR